MHMTAVREIPSSLEIVEQKDASEICYYSLTHPGCDKLEDIINIFSKHIKDHTISLKHVISQELQTSKTTKRTTVD